MALGAAEAAGGLVPVTILTPPGDDEPSPRPGTQPRRREVRAAAEFTADAAEEHSSIDVPTDEAADEESAYIGRAGMPAVHAPVRAQGPLP